MLFMYAIAQAGGGKPSSVTKTEFSTFTYFITSLSGLSTVTSTDIVISSNVIGRASWPDSNIGLFHGL